MRKIIAHILIITMLLNWTGTALASGSVSDSQKIQFGEIQVLGVEAASFSTYRGARDDKNGIVYINAEDFASIIGGAFEVREKENGYVIDYWVGNWKIEVDTEKSIGQVSYYFGYNMTESDVSVNDSFLMQSMLPEIKANSDRQDSLDSYNRRFRIYQNIYDSFSMTDCVFNEQENNWYLPFEEMLYMYAAQWICYEGVVLVYRPDTLFDVLADCEAWRNHIVRCEELLGEGGSQVWFQKYSNRYKNPIDEAEFEEWLGKTFKYGILAPLDDIDVRFIFDSVVVSLTGGEMKYTEDTIKKAIIQLLTDAPIQEDGFKKGIDNASNFIGAAATVLDLICEKLDSDKKLTQKQALTQKQNYTMLEKMLNLPKLTENLPKINNCTSAGAPLIQYALSVGQILWTRDLLEENLEKRIEFIEKAAEKRIEQDEFFKTLKDAAHNAREIYFGGEYNVYMDNLSMDNVVSIMEGSIAIAEQKRDKLIGKATGKIIRSIPASMKPIAVTGAKFLSHGLDTFNTVQCTVAVIDLTVETAKVIFPGFREGLEDAENAHICLYLIPIAKMMEGEFKQALQILRTQKPKQEVMNDARMSALLMMNASLHGHEIINKLERQNIPKEGYEETAFILRLLESSKYDALLLMKSDFGDIISDEHGKMRHDIPVEYVEVNNFVIVTTAVEQYETSSSISTVVIPTVYISGNPEAEKHINEELTEYCSARLGRPANPINEPIVPEESRNTTDVNIRNIFSCGSLLFIDFGISEYAGGAYDTNYTRSWIFDTSTGEQVNLKQIFSDAPEARNQLAAHIAARLQEELDKDKWTDLDYSVNEVARLAVNEEMGDWVMTEAGFRVVFPRQSIASNRSFVIEIPYKELLGIWPDKYFPTIIDGSGSIDIILPEQETDFGELGAYVLKVEGLVQQITVTEYDGTDAIGPRFYANYMKDQSAVLPACRGDAYWAEYYSDGRKFDGIAISLSTIE